jgi:hypothetical protein
MDRKLFPNRLVPYRIFRRKDMETTSVFGLIKNKYGGFPVNKSGRLALLRWKGKVRAAQERIV